MKLREEVSEIILIWVVCGTDKVVNVGDRYGALKSHVVVSLYPNFSGHLKSVGALIPT